MPNTGGDPDAFESRWELPDGWPETPSYAVFFLAAPVPLGLPSQWKGSLLLNEQPVEWLKGIVTPASSAIRRFNIPYNPEGRPFVSLHAEKFPIPFGLDSDQFLLARAAYEKMKGAEEFELDLHFYTRAVAGAFQSGSSTSATVFEVLTPLEVVRDPHGQSDLEASIWRAFRRTLDILEVLYRAYVTTVDDWAVRPLSRQQLNPLVHWTTLDASTGEIAPVRLFQVNDANRWPLGAKETLSDEMMQHLQNHIQVILSSGDNFNPHLTFVENAKRAQHAYHAEGDYDAAVIWSHISSESLLTGALLMSAWEVGTDANEATGWIRTPLRKRVRAYFGRQFGGIWDTRESDTIVGRWSHSVVRVRNSIVHASNRANEQDAVDAHNACVDLERYVKRRLFERRNQYPRTALVFIGIGGMQDRGVEDKWLEETLAKMEEEPSLADTYGQWAQEVYARVDA